MSRPVAAAIVATVGVVDPGLATWRRRIPPGGRGGGEGNAGDDAGQQCLRQAQVCK